MMSIAEMPGAPSPQPSATRDAARGPAARVTSRDLLGERSELIIVHAGREYKLRITQNGKLILTA